MPWALLLSFAERLWGLMSHSFLRRRCLLGAHILLVASFTGMLAVSAPVTITEDDRAYTLDNGVLTARISKSSADLLSLQFRDREMLDVENSRQGGYWSHTPQRAAQIIARVTIDPRQNGGKRGEVSVKGIAQGKQLGSGPGGSVVADIEIRYALGAEDTGLHTYAIFSHPTNYPATSLGEARFCLKLNDELFDWMTVDKDRNRQMLTARDWNRGTPLNYKEVRRLNSGIHRGEVEHKYDYSANQFDVRTWGWSSSREKIGLWLINPSVEYLSGGPTKFELSAHRDATFSTNNPYAAAPPTLLNYWRSSHYGGSLCNVGTNDAWAKVVGPFLIYCNHTTTHSALWPDALARGERETQAWPYDWVNHAEYPRKAERSIVTGRIRLDDPLMAGGSFTNLLVGLTAPDYSPAFVPRANRTGFRRFWGGGGFGLGGGGEDDANRMSNSVPGTNFFRPSNLPRVVEWQNDARNYQFWVRANANGEFSIPHVRAGNYTLRAIADGVLGELAVTNLNVATGTNLALGEIAWQPLRLGRQLWDIGIPNRRASEFFKGDEYFRWGWYVKYPQLFPRGVNYVIGQSDFRRDWFFIHVPSNSVLRNVDGTAPGRETTWTISFNVTNSLHGTATLRLGLCAAGTRALAVAINGQSIGSVTNLINNGTIHRDGIGGTWSERRLMFDAEKLRLGTNSLALTVPAGPLPAGVMYDYLRLEVNESAVFSK